MVKWGGGGGGGEVGRLWNVFLGQGGGWVGG